MMFYRSADFAARRKREYEERNDMTRCAARRQAAANSATQRARCPPAAAAAAARRIARVARAAAFASVMPLPMVICRALSALASAATLPRRAAPARLPPSYRLMPPPSASPPR